MHLWLCAALAMALTAPPASAQSNSQFGPYQDLFPFQTRLSNLSRLPFFSPLRNLFSNIRGVRTDLLTRNVSTGSLYGSRSNQAQYETRLVGGSNSREGNVEVFVTDWRDGSSRWRSVCDIGWTDKHALAVCQYLGFPGTAVATHNGRFGFRSPSIGTLVAHCQVGRYGLQYCYHNGLEGTRECSYNNLAGVICGTDPSQPLNQAVEVRLVRGTRERGDVEVRYGNSGWGPVCADGFDLKDAAVVCRMLNLGAPRRSYISGRDAGKPFIMSGVECSTTDRNLGFCRSVRGPDLICEGRRRRDRFNGAAVECSRDLPDLVVDHKEVEDSAYVEELSVDELDCARDEGCLSSSANRANGNSNRTLLRFTNKVKNIGARDYRPSLDSSQWVWHSCHGHYHSEESFSEYDLTRPGSNVKVAEGHKASFCLEDSVCNAGISNRYRCLRPDISARPPQGIRAGCADIYSANIDCQWIDVTDIPSGDYHLKVRVNADMLTPEQSFDNNQVTCNAKLQLNSLNARCRRNNSCPKPYVSITNCRVTGL